MTFVIITAKTLPHTRKKHPFWFFYGLVSNGFERKKIEANHL